jgi:hypothetical protein
MDKFPEAFKRFKEKVNVDKIETWKQTDALQIQAKRLGIPTEGYRTREEEVQKIFVQSAKETRVATAQQREKRFSIGYLDFQQWLSNTTRTTAYQRRVINYIKNHPNASLAEARGHKTKRS